MVLSVDYSSNAILGFTAVVGFALCTALFYRTHKNEPAQPPSLNKERVSSMADLSIADRVYNLFTPTKTLLEIGNPVEPLPTSYDLVNALTEARKQHQVCETLVIYSNNFEIWQDPGIVLLKPKKLILEGAYISTNRTSGFADSLMKAGWSTKKGSLVIVDVNSVEEAINAAPVDPLKPQPTVYRVNHF
jgi:hypothetical protein